MLPTISTENLHFTTVSCNRPNPTRGFIQKKPNARIATTTCHPKFQNVRFTTVACAKMYESSARRPGQPAAYKNHHFTTVSDIWPARSDERVAPATAKFAFHHSFGRPMSTKRREGCQRTQANSHFTSVLDVRRARSDKRVATAIYKIRISPQFWTSDEHEVTRGLRGEVQNLHFTTVLDVRWARSDERVVSRLGQPNPPCVKKKKEVLRKSWSTAILSRSSQQIFSADFLSRSSQQIFSADLLSRSSQQIFSADLLSRSSQQIFSADLLSRFSQQIFSADLLHSRSSQQIFSADCLSRSSQQIFTADLLSYHVAVVRGWWSAIVWSLAVVRGWWSAIVSSFAVVRGWWSAIVWSAIVLSFAVVRGWWSAIILSCWWSILHEFFRRTLSRSFREKHSEELIWIEGKRMILPRSWFKSPCFSIPFQSTVGAESHLLASPHLWFPWLLLSEVLHLRFGLSVGAKQELSSPNTRRNMSWHSTGMVKMMAASGTNQTPLWTTTGIHLLWFGLTWREVDMRVK